MKRFRLHYINIFTQSECARIIKSESEEDAKIWFYSNLDNENLLDWIEEVPLEVGVCG